MNKKKFTILTLFPEAFNDFINTSIIKKAIKEEKIIIEIINIRDFCTDKQKQADDYPYGGGTGMVLKALPVIKAIEKAKTKSSNAKVILLTPQGQLWTQEQAFNYAQSDNNYIFICGHYEGIDERISKFVDQEISIGNYVLTGGEVPVMILVDSISRLVKGVLSDESVTNESHTNNLLDYPTYTRPEVVCDMAVPQVLLSGNHKEIALYRKKQALINTYKKRIDLFNQHQLTQEEANIIEEYLADEKKIDKKVSTSKKEKNIKKIKKIKR
ncbi:MAG: tRNA (guanosine(37)-N1)-methyltransferase TrmD [Spiroplasma sp.]|nr:tRNA (guanosine(37)-N1)-methyltransferase TrmD [Spiroplasma sp.]